LHGHVRQVAAGAVVILALVAAYTWWHAPLPVPRVTRIVQLSNDGFDKGSALATDGPRIYFTASQGATQFLAEVAEGAATRI
jgi:hypothetical protein